jgi:hypothetical protein
MKTVLHVCMAILVGAATWAADQRSAPLRQASSDNGRFLLQIRPGRPDAGAIHGCKAALYERASSRSRGRPVWERFLVNDVAPAQAFIRSDGRFVVTLDEYGRGGARNALVIYGQRGELLRHFLLSDLLDGPTWTEIQRRGDSLIWLDGARCQFLNSPPTFQITLRRGHKITVDLEKLQVMRPFGSPSDPSAMPPEIFELLFGLSPEHAAAEDSATATTAQEGDQQEALAEDQDDAGEDVAEESEVQPEMASTEESEGELYVASETERFSAPDEAAEAVEPDAAQTTDEDPGPQMAAEEPSTEEEMAETPTAAEAAPALSEVGGVPLPDPAAPVDYLAWANSLTSTDGPSALPQYQAAFDAFKVCDSALYDAALAGDPGALNSPEIQNWLADNQAALEHWRDALELDYRGWPMKSPDGSMIGALLPHLSSMRQLSKAAILEGRYLALSGRPEAAVDNYMDVFVAGAQAGAGPTVIEGLVGTAIQSLGAGGLLDLAASPAGERLDYGALADRLAQSPAGLPEPATAMQFEQAAFMDSLQRLYAVDAASGEYVLDSAKVADFLKAAEPDRDPQSIASESERIADVGFAQTVADASAYYDSVAEAMARPFPEAQQRLREIERPFQERTANPLLATMAPSLMRYHEIVTRSDATQRAAQLVTQLRAYRQTYGDYPDSLDAFARENVAVDPFTSRGFVYRRTGDDFVLYSAGANGVDDGGRHNPRGDTGDIIYWPRPQPAKR